MRGWTMALAKRSRGGMSGWVAAAMLALAVYAAQTPAAETGADDDQVTPVVETAESH